MKRNAIRVFLMALSATLAGAQTFEAASVKPAAPGGRYGMRGDPGQIEYSQATLKEMLTRAYGIEAYQVEGPLWLAEARYDVVAKLPAGATKEGVRAMLRNLLEERFGLVAHRETKELAIYALVVGKNGPKLKISGSKTDAGTGEQAEVSTVSLAKDGLPVMPAGYKGHVIGMKLPGRTALRARQETLADFAKVLCGLLDRPVFDFTGLTDKYDFAIAWSDDGQVPLPGVFGAMQADLGLKLEPRKTPVEMLVVDRANRVPVAN